MTDDELIETWGTLEPSAEARRRIDARVSEWLDAPDTSIAAEWLGLVQVSPVGAFGLAAVSAVAIVLLTPLAWVAGALAGALM